MSRSGNNTSATLAAWHTATLALSLKYRNHTVNDIIAQGLPVSMLLGALAFGFAMGVGLPFGFFTAARRGRWPDYAGSFLAVLAVCVPGFVVAPLLILVFAIKWKLAAGRLVGIAVAHDFAAHRARPVFRRQNRAPLPRRHVECHAIRIRHRRARQGTRAKTGCCSNTPAASPCCRSCPIPVPCSPIC